MSKICLEMEKVHKHFTRKEGKRKVKIHALNDVTFSVEENTSLAIIGSSGCGKSTLVKVLLGIVKPDDGRFFVEWYSRVCRTESLCIAFSYYENWKDCSGTATFYASGKKLQGVYSCGKTGHGYCSTGL